MQSVKLMINILLTIIIGYYLRYSELTVKLITIDGFFSTYEYMKLYLRENVLYNIFTNMECVYIDHIFHRYLIYILASIIYQLIKNLFWMNTSIFEPLILLISVPQLYNYLSKKNILFMLKNNLILY